jgi:hypothetical protein
MATATTQALALATLLRLTKWEMARAARAIVTNAFAAITIVLASAVAAAVFIAATNPTIPQRCCPQRSHCSGCCHHPPLQHCNQTAMAWVMVTEAMAMATRVAGKGWQQW